MLELLLKTTTLGGNGECEVVRNVGLYHKC